MIKMFGEGGEQDAQPGGCNLAVGLRLKGAKERKTCQAVYSGTCTSGQVPPHPHPPPLSFCMYNPTSKGICPLIPL